jgi:hypothetical protein
MKKTLLALGLAASLSAGAAGIASAQNTGMTMDMGLSMIELSVGNEFSRLGLGDVDVMSLTLEQVSELRNILNDSGNNDGDRTQMIRRASTGAEPPHPVRACPGPDSFRINQQISALGV